MLFTRIGFHFMYRSSVVNKSSVLYLVQEWSLILCIGVESYIVLV